MCTISASSFRNIIQAISSSNFKIKSLVNHYAEQLIEENDDDKLKLSIACRFFNDASQYSGDADIGLSAYKHARPDFFGIAGYSLMSSPTLDIALERLAKYHPLVADSSFITLDDENEHFIISAFNKGLPSTEVTRHIIDAAAAVILGLIHWLAFPLKLQPVFVDLPYPKPAETINLQRLFGKNINFDAPHIRLVFDSEIKKKSIYSRNPGFEDVHRRYADAQLEEKINGSLMEKVRSVFSSGMTEGRLISLQEMATTLNMSKRTLQKYLEEEGVTFSALQEALRKELASNLIASSALSLKEISSILGFSQSSSLSKACQRWFSLSPGQLRAQNQKS
ncbi:AraC family transcriptional regulator [Pseudomonas sp. B2M1-30]|uniref:AraC family transcriptional regulator n=1 Tax=Pseudomonas TaxID=286 RepID=UPI001C3CC6C8|nr:MULTISPECIES: AraC family transcriptional regulator [Pseudomonas]MBV4473596.1 AraC family transcriptional regulator [Pseudomonas botevensis]MCU0117736.1 AraC family transcriptional regulator [Pseudomonas sp. B2M1-30]MCU7259272.1 AraC family transcriptional regulator [Pseudomonas koreensis]